MRAARRQLLFFFVLNNREAVSPPTLRLMDSIPETGSGVTPLSE
jgi:hypothetical protein